MSDTRSSLDDSPTPEHDRLSDARDGVPWRRWGPYLAGRQWGTVREDYSPDGTAWEYFPHDHARSRAYRWGEDGLLGISDDRGLLCFGLGLWNGVDPILKERLFGLTGNEGNHGEDVKECYYFLDNTPTHSYMKALYRYPQRAFPYDDLVAQNRRRGRDQPEYELEDTGIFAEGRYFDVVVEYAKVAPEDILIRISATNRGPEAAPLHLLPTLWFRNTWAWGSGSGERPVITAEAVSHDSSTARASHPEMGDHWLFCFGSPALLFTGNETNTARLWDVPNGSPFVKDGIENAVVHGLQGATNPGQNGTKMAAHYQLSVEPRATDSLLLRLSKDRQSGPFMDAEAILDLRRSEADAFYGGFGGERLSADEPQVQRQAFAGLLWSKQFYYFDVDVWLRGDPAGPAPSPGRIGGRNREWRHLNNADVLSMPDTWEYPWFAAWDLAFHCIPLALIDPEFAKEQLMLLLREWYLHPNGDRLYRCLAENAHERAGAPGRIVGRCRRPRCSPGGAGSDPGRG